MNTIPLVVIVYDSITNSVFESQVIIPLMQQYQVTKKIIIITFEKELISAHITETLANNYSTITFIILKRFPLISILNLYFDSWRVKKILSKFSIYQLQARGPLAGFIALKAHSPLHCTQILIQARGLLAQEYRYTNSPLSWLGKLRYQVFENIEAVVYGQKNIPVTIQAVSCALKEYLIHTYNTAEQTIIIAEHDTPPTISAHQVQAWRREIREQLSIDNTVHVYCYNGSIKPWQCPQDVIQFFQEELAKTSHIFLLVLTQDKQQFTEILHATKIQPQQYQILTVPHNQIYRYLAACDSGIIFRKPDIINWVSRPTKVLEYNAVGLTIIHNNTIAELQNYNNNPATIADNKLASVPPSTAYKPSSLKT